jgi:hypothetical protein
MEQLMQGVLAQTPAPTGPRASGVVLSDPQTGPGAPPGLQAGGESAPVEPPSWMLDAPSHTPSSVRTGASPMRSSGLGTFGFFAAIVLVVGLAGTVGVLFWGPDKTTSSRTHLATDPPPPVALPSLADSAEVPPAVSVALSASADPPPADPAPAKKGKKARAKKGR